MKIGLITPYLKKIIDYGTWVIFFLIFTYSLLYYVTRNAVPGDFLYPTKLGVERILIASSRIVYRSVDFEIGFVAMRFDEVSKVLASQYGQESLQRLDSQVTETADTISKIKDPKARKEAANKYIIQLSYISSGLEQEQRKITSTTQNNYYPAPTSSTPNLVYPTTPPPSSPPPNIITEIDNTQDIIKDTIDEMNEIQSNSANFDTDRTESIPTPTKKTTIPSPTQIPPSPTSEPTDKPKKNLDNNPAFNQSEYVSPTSPPKTIDPTSTPIPEPTSVPEQTVTDSGDNNN